MIIHVQSLKYILIMMFQRLQMDYQFLPQMVERFEMVELHRNERVDRFDITQKPRLYA